MTHSKGKQASSRDPEYKSRLQQALAKLGDGTYKTVTAAANAHQVACQTLSDRASGLHQSRQEAAKNSQVLSAAEEKVMINWLNFNLSAATPLHPCDLCACAFEISGKMPGRHWHDHFLQQHKKEVITHKPHHLDPKRAQNFNKTTVEEYFRLQKQMVDQYGEIPVEHNWNMNEK
ncbi:hypothetical protein PAXRUDRAFT_19542 [Paxillus rubicundulus Ve08.2h10]|uniref:HTH CENPB-type domain-containing protein n=1 Tax=Paxillus rubicundulus Ve08.2h10 TaxID=930991 RepID=A0A0D0BTL4_9AGAM|nr:hypothetical protein PAXRUDRAFT_19542 [Paxillus rubicundulus Ve08.2h10]